MSAFTYGNQDPYATQYSQPGQFGQPQQNYSDPPPGYDQVTGQPFMVGGPPPPPGYAQPVNPAYPPPAGPGFPVTANMVNLQIVHTGQPGGQMVVPVMTEEQAAQAAQGQAIAAMMLSRVPVSVSCPHCKTTVTTEVEKEVGPMAWFWCFFFCFMCLPCLLWIPFVVDAFKDAVHYCPTCKNELGRARTGTVSAGGGRRRRRGRIGHGRIGHGVGVGRRARGRRRGRRR